MIQKNISMYINKEFSDELEPISDLSKSTAGKVLVKDDRCLYNFDSITKKIYKFKKVPSSVDALFVTNKVLLLTEFKSGFKRRISKESIDYKKLTCPKNNKIICKDYGEMLIRKADLETQELLDSVKFKAVESYITLEKQIFPRCMNLPIANKLRVVFCVVIDDYIDDMENTLAELAGTSTIPNSFESIKNALSRFVQIKTADNEDFYYDEIKVFSPYEYKHYLNSLQKRG